MAIKPLEDRVVVETLAAEEKTAGGIVLPDTAKEKPQKGKIVAVGAGKLLESGKRAAMSVKKGDVVIFAKFSGTEVRVSGKDYVIMKENEILAKVEK